MFFSNPTQKEKISKSVVFWSSFEASVFMSAIVKSISANGIIAEHRYIISNDEYRKASTKVSRLFLRFRMYIEYPIRLGFKLFNNDAPTFIVITTNTFYAPLIALFLKRSNQHVIHLVWDLFPDVLSHKANNILYGWTYRIIDRIVRFIMKNVSANVFLGRHLLLYARSRFDSISQPFVIPVGADADIFNSSPPTPPTKGQKIKIAYCGNLGTMHDTETVIGILTKENLGIFDNISISFYSSGPMIHIFKKALSGLNLNYSSKIEVKSPLGSEEWVSLMQNTHVALVTMTPGSEQLVMPSKTYSALASGQAILAICPINSDLAELIYEENCGWVVEPGDIKALSEMLRIIGSDADALKSKRQNAFLAGQNKFSNKAIASAWITVLNDISEL